MNKYTAGTFHFIKKEPKAIYYTDDFKTFFDKDGNVLNQDTIEEWAEWLNSPWSCTTESWVITFNMQSNGYEPDKENIYKCEYIVVGYECVTATVFGYGKTEAEALQSCKEHFEYLQKEYNKEQTSY